MPECVRGIQDQPICAINTRTKYSRRAHLSRLRRALASQGRSRRSSVSRTTRASAISPQSRARDACSWSMPAAPSVAPSSATCSHRRPSTTAGSASSFTVAFATPSRSRSCRSASRRCGTCPLKTDKRGEGQRDMPVRFAGVNFRPGDWLYADEDGLIVASPRADMTLSAIYDVVRSACFHARRSFTSPRIQPDREHEERS